VGDIDGQLQQWQQEISDQLDSQAQGTFNTRTRNITTFIQNYEEMLQIPNVPDNKKTFQKKDILMLRTWFQVTGDIYKAGSSPTSFFCLEPTCSSSMYPIAGSLCQACC